MILMMYLQAMLLFIITVVVVFPLLFVTETPSSEWPETQKNVQHSVPQSYVKKNGENSAKFNNNFTQWNTANRKTTQTVPSLTLPIIVVTEDLHRQGNYTLLFKQLSTFNQHVSSQNNVV